MSDREWEIVRSLGKKEERSGDGADGAAVEK